MKLGDFIDSTYYRVSCDCQSEECDLTLELQIYGQLIFLNMYKNLKASSHWGGYWNHFDFIRVWKNKIKMIWSILMKGYIEVNESTVLRGEEHIRSFIEALEEGIIYVKQGCPYCPESKEKGMDRCRVCNRFLDKKGNDNANTEDN